MAKTAWVCEKCGSSFEQLEEAESCEDNHISIDQLKITEILFNESTSINPEFITVVKDYKTYYEELVYELKLTKKRIKNV